MNVPLNTFYVSRFRVTANADSTIKIPGFKGFSLRDCFQQALSLYVACPDTYAIEACQKCKKNDNCLYQTFFRAKVPADNPTARAFQKNPPTAFAFDPIDIAKNDYEDGEQFVFDIILFGKTIKFIKKLIPVFHLMGEIGIGSRHSKFGQRGQFSLFSVQSIDFQDKSKTIYIDGKIQTPFKPYCITLNEKGKNKPGNNTITLNFFHPLMIFDKSKLLVKELEIRHIVNALINRIKLLSNFYCDIPYQDTFSLSDGKNEGKSVSKKLHIHNYRYSSSRQKKTIIYKAVRGNMQIENMDNEVIQLLNLGRHIFIGRNTSSGFGKYLIEQ